MSFHLLLVTFFLRTPTVFSFFFSGSLITTNSCRLTKHFLLLSGSGYAPNRHELPFGCEIGHVAGNVLWACSQGLEGGRGRKKEKEGAPWQGGCAISIEPDLLRKRVCLVFCEKIAFITLWKSLSRAGAEDVPKFVTVTFLLQSAHYPHVFQFHLWSGAWA